uniref:Leishmanolysin homolog n=1 Tax=Tanacetum cinerariifolium TaxID=118510 RepID=A0A699J0I1_TANCI|nr:leishmanolysin homolog [Tanacetum cinerariifolium]
MDEKLGRTVTHMALQRVFKHSRNHYETYSQDFTHTKLEDGGDCKTSVCMLILLKLSSSTATFHLPEYIMQQRRRNGDESVEINVTRKC